ncbi:MAG: HNH endonuclease [Melioribacteraceae bacterium]|nr:HNH endonuclease [Candidatus Pacearchaeota archaeon]MCF8356678.1 HNH endonuclease [Melioribacteraceae bacterium]
MIINNKKINLEFIYSNIKLPNIYKEYLIKYKDHKLIFTYLIKHIIKTNKSIINECWLWDKHHDKDGYPKYLGLPLQRIIWEITRQRKIEPNYVIRHTCDNPNCINPFHLLSGSQADNAKDKVMRGRSITCEDHSSAKLKNNDIPNIIDLYINKNQTFLDISKLYGVSETVINEILNGKLWKNITKNYNLNFNQINNIKKKNMLRNKLNESDVINIRKLFKQGYSKAQISRKYNLGPTTITNIIDYKSWAHVK